MNNIDISPCFRRPFQLPMLCFSGFDIAESIVSSPACNVINEPMILISTKAMHISQHELLLSFQKLPNLLLSLMFCFLITSWIISLPIKYLFNYIEILVIVRGFGGFNLIVKETIIVVTLIQTQNERKYSY